jgi:Pentapeptide repeats (8 copies)
MASHIGELPHALERIAWDSPERDYSTVIEVLTAYVRENTPQSPRPSNGSSEAAAASNEATAAADEGAKQPTPPKPGRPTADIQAILDVLRRAQDRVPEEYRTRLYLHEADLRGAILQIANLREAVLFRANFQGALLGGTNLQIANLGGAILKGAKLGAAKLGGADLRGADLRGATLFLSDITGANFQGAKVTDEDRGDLVFTPWTQGATMPDGQNYEDWIKDKKAVGSTWRTNNPRSRGPNL